MAAANAEKTRIKYEGTLAVLLCYAVLIPTLVGTVTFLMYTDLNSMEVEYIFQMCFSGMCPTLLNVFWHVSTYVVTWLSPAFFISLFAALFLDMKR